MATSGTLCLLHLLQQPRCARLPSAWLRSASRRGTRRSLSPHERRGRYSVYEWHWHGGNTVSESQNQAEERSLPTECPPDHHRMRGRVRLQGAGVPLPELQPEAGADVHPQSAGRAHLPVLRTGRGGVAVRPQPHHLQGVPSGALCHLRLLVHRNQRQVPAGDSAAADRQPDAALRLHLLLPLLPLLPGRDGDGAADVPGAGHVAAHPGHLRRLRAPTCAHAPGRGVWNNGLHLALDCDGHFCHREDAAALENGTCTLPSHSPPPPPPQQPPS